MGKFYQFIIEQREKHMEERDERDAPEVAACSFIDRQAVGGKSAPTESPPRLQLPMPGLQLLRLDHAPALLAFERENRAYFAASVPDRGDEFFAEFDTRYAQLLEWQAAGTDYLHLLVAEGSEVVGRVNLTEVADGSAGLGDRIAQKAAGQGLATAAGGALAPPEERPSRLRAGRHPDDSAPAHAPYNHGIVARGSRPLNGRAPV